jgi:uncharacterized protein (TIGR00369 family)
MNTLLEMGKLSLAAQPFSCYMGVEFESAAVGDVVLSLPVKEEYKQNFGTIHGGVISYMADIGLVYAAASTVKDCVTSELKINYVKPAVGDKVIARAKTVAVGKRQVVCECRVLTRVNGSDEEALVAIALGTVSRRELESQ